MLFRCGYGTPATRRAAAPGDVTLRLRTILRSSLLRSLGTVALSLRFALLPAPALGLGTARLGSAAFAPRLLIRVLTLPIALSLLRLMLRTFVLAALRILRVLAALRILG